MKAFVAFIEKYHPGFSREIEPADEIDIELLEEYAGPLPGAYRRFLQTMGASMGSLALAEASFSVAGTLATYQTMRWLRQGRFIYAAGDNGLAGWDYFLDRARPHGADDCMLVRMPLEEEFSPEGCNPRYVGLEEFLYYEAFKTLRLPLLSHRWNFATPESPGAAAKYRADSVTDLAEEEGFRRIPPAVRCALYERDDAGLLLYQHPIEPVFSFALGCMDSAEAARLARAFEMRIGLRGRPST